MLLSRETYNKNRDLFHKMTLLSYDKIDELLSLEQGEFSAKISQIDKFVRGNGHSIKYITDKYCLNNMMWEMYRFKNSVHIKLSDVYSYEDDYHFDVTDMNPEIEYFAVDFEMCDGVRVCAYIGQCFDVGVYSGNMAKYSILYRVNKPYGKKYESANYMSVVNSSNSEFVTHPQGTFRKCLSCEACKKQHRRNAFKESCDLSYGCDLSKCSAGIDRVLPNMVASIILSAVKKYMSRSTEVRERWRTGDINRKLMEPNDSSGDVYRLLPNVEVTYIHKEPRVYEWKGGHHASPVAHKRKSHYRRCKMGNYKLCGGQFVEVPRGEGTHVRVRESKVNWDTNRVQVNILRMS